MTAFNLDLPQTAIMTPTVVQAHRAAKWPVNFGGTSSETTELVDLLNRAFRGWAVSSALIEVSSDPLALYQHEQAQQQLRIKQAKVAAVARLTELKLEAIRTRNLVSQGSLQDLRDALGSLAFTRRPAIFMLENGNFRVMWKNAAREQVAVQFLGDQNVQFVIFAKDARGPMTRLTGITTLDRLSALIIENKATRLLS